MWLLGKVVAADLDARDAQDRAPVHIAVQAGAHDAVRSLVAAGADPTLACSKGGNTLRQATVDGDATMVAILLAAAAKPERAAGYALALHEFTNSVFKDGWTALGLAARGGKAAVAQALLAGGADPAAVIKANGKTALEIARVNKKSSVAELLEAARV